MSNLSRYVDYFRQLAITHSQILHDPTSETGDSKVGKKRFAKWSAEEVVSGLRSKVGDRVLLIELYETDLYAANVFDIKERPRGAFTFLKSTKPADIRDQESALEFKEQVVYDLLRQIWQDHYGVDKDRCATPFLQFCFEKIQIAPIGPIYTDNYCGWRVEFDFEFQQLYNITIAPDEGTFIQSEL